MNNFEIEILMFIHSFTGCEILDTFFKNFTLLGNSGIIWIILSAVFLIFPKTRKCGITMVLGLIMCLIFGNILLKPLISRPRPFDVNPALDIIIKKPTDFSFPSGHTFSSFASAVIIFKYNKKYGAAAIALASLMAFSRLYLTVHYPTDVLAGIILGIIIAVSANKIIERKSV